MFFFGKTQNLGIFKRVTKVAILKLEHCVFHIWLLICTLIIPCCLFFQYLIHFQKNEEKNQKFCYCFLKFIDGAQNFRIEKYKRQRIKRNVLASKLRPVKTFRGEKMLLYKREGNSATAERHGWSYIWQRSSSHNVCMVTECMKFLGCL